MYLDPRINGACVAFIATVCLLQQVFIPPFATAVVQATGCRKSPPLSYIKKYKWNHLKQRNIITFLIADVLSYYKLLIAPLPVPFLHYDSSHDPPVFSIGRRSRHREVLTWPTQPASRKGGMPTANVQTSSCIIHIRFACEQHPHHTLKYNKQCPNLREISTRKKSVKYLHVRMKSVVKYLHVGIFLCYLNLFHY